MTYTFYEHTFPILKRGLTALTNILKKAESHPNSANFLSARLADDMLPLSFQVFVVADLVSKATARLTGEEPQMLDRDGVKTFADAYALIDKMRALAETAAAATVDAAAHKTVTVGMGPGKSADMEGAQYVDGYTFPNMFFHITTAYAILRKEGVQLGKQDYLTPFLAEFVTM